MDLLRKADNLAENPREANADKLPLFPKGVSICTAQHHRTFWEDISDPKLQDNISYQMQYLEFQIKLYNTYQMYLTLESLHLKNIRATIASIIEAALYGLVYQAWKVADYEVDEQISFMDLIDEAYDMNVLDEDLRNQLHTLRKHRNKVHFRTLEYKEYKAYEVDEINEAIKTLNAFIIKTQPEPKPSVTVEEIEHPAQ